MARRSGEDQSHEAEILKDSQTEFHAPNIGAVILLRPGFIIGSVRNPSRLMCSCQQDALFLAAPQG